MSMCVGVGMCDISKRKIKLPNHDIMCTRHHLLGWMFDHKIKTATMNQRKKKERTTK